MTRTIVYFVDSLFFGGTEQALLHLLAGLDRQRWQPILYHHEAPGITTLAEKAHQLNVQTRTVPRMVGSSTISGLPRFLEQLIKDKPVVFHAQLNWLLSGKYGILAAALARKPVIATLQQFMEPPWGKMIDFQQQLLAHCVDQYIAVSNAVARQLCDTFQVPAQKVKVIPNCVPFPQTSGWGKSSLRSDLGLSTERPVVLTVARLDQQKGHTFLLQAIRQVPEVTFVMAGSGPERPTLEAMARELGIDERVIFLGHREDIPGLLACCDLFVLPSIYEGLPLSLLEAMDAGKAVVATAVGGTPELVREGETGFLVPKRDPAALARAIQRLLSDPELTHRMGKAGKNWVQQNYSVKNMVQQITETYEELLDRHGRQSG
jgi:glycosyltransferase involved in cell wall biosynthesis